MRARTVVSVIVAVCSVVVGASAGSTVLSQANAAPLTRTASR
jgi:hypothetical protein